jgi:hypothetical protein
LPLRGKPLESLLVPSRVLLLTHAARRVVGLAAFILAAALQTARESARFQQSSAPDARRSARKSASRLLFVPLRGKPLSKFLFGRFLVRLMQRARRASRARPRSHL